MNRGFTEHLCGDIVYLTSPILSELGVRHCFTTRLGGVSKAHLSSLNLGVGRGDSPQALEENFRRLFAALGFTGEALSSTRQVHGTRITVIDKPRFCGEECDGLVTNRPHSPLMSFAADCVPILLYDPLHKACGAVHSGWRGTVKRIGEKAVKRMTAAYGSDPRDMFCAIGPSIGPCCFQVRDDVVTLFSDGFDTQALFTPDGDGEHYHGNLWEAVRQTLMEAGVQDEHIDYAGECTCCHPQRYFSCRGQHGTFGVQGALIEL